MTVSAANATELVNDEIRAVAAKGLALGVERWGFLCECPDLECRELVHLTLDEFDARRASSPRVPVLAEHLS